MDKQILEEMLTLQKHTDLNYSMFADECATMAMHTDVMNILNEEHKIQSELFSEMSANGWYSPADAESQKIEQAKQKFQSCAMNQNS
ncbi:MAG: spore coat protein [Ruminococcaceae bacterium]|nr:spore coat protein [Oscillospiraceae bacterium]